MLRTPSHQSVKHTDDYSGKTQIKATSHKDVKLASKPQLKTTRPKPTRANGRSRPLGHLESFSTIRHDMKFYSGVMVSGVYTHGPSETGIPKKQLYAALRKVVTTYPNLCTVLSGQNTTKPHFQILDQIDLDDHVIFVPRPKDEREQLNTHELYLNQEIRNREKVPLWRIIVSPKMKDNELLFVDGTEIAFYYHHAIGDGVSGKIFLTSLLDSLNSLDETFGGTEAFKDSENTINGKKQGMWDNLVEVPQTMTVHKNLEKVLKMPQSLKHIAKTLGQEFGLIRRHGFWTGMPIPDNMKYTKFPETKIQRLKVPAHKMVALLEACRRQNTTMACLITSLALVAVNGSIPVIQNGAQLTKIQCVLPFNLRPFMNNTMALGVGANSMGDYAASIEVPFSRADLTGTTASLVVTTSNSSGVFTGGNTNVVWEASQRLRQKLDRRIAKGNKDLNVGLIKYAGNLRSFFKQKSGRMRTNTLEVSSICVDAPPHQNIGPKGHTRNVSAATQATLAGAPAWILTDLVFSQAVSSEGAAINLSAISYKGGDLTISFVWAAEIVSDEIVSSVIQNFDELLEEIWLDAI